MIPRTVFLLFTMFAAAFAGLVSGCTGRAEGEPAVQRTTLAYFTGPGENPARHRLDLYRPAGGTALPVLVFVHGGVWQLGSKDDYQHVGEAFARRGILTVIVNYRLSPDVTHPAHAKDVARAVGWVVRHAAEYGARPDRVYLSGHSAGGHLVSLVLFDPQYLRVEGVDPDTLAGVIPLSGIFDLTQPVDDSPEGGFAQYVQPSFGDRRDVLGSASPIRHLRPTRVRLLVILAGGDYQAMRHQSSLFVDALRRRSLDVTFETIKGRGHFALVQAIGRAQDPTTELITLFVR